MSDDSLIKIITAQETAIAELQAENERLRNRVKEMSSINIEDAKTIARQAMTIESLKRMGAPFTSGY